MAFDLPVPDYGERSFSGLVSAIPSLFQSEFPSYLKLPGISNFNNLIIFFFDGFGFRHLEKRLETNPTLQMFNSEGTVTKFGACFPTTTSAHVTYFHSGVPHWESAVYEWFMYSAENQLVVQPLLWSRPGLKSGGLELKPEDILPQARLYPELKKQDILLNNYIKARYAKSTYNQFISGATNTFGFKKLVDGADLLVKNIKSNPAQRQYATIYTDALDQASHDHGPESLQAAKAIENVLKIVQDNLITPLKNLASRSLLLIISDHGSIEVDPKDAIYLDRKDPEIIKLIREDFFQRPILPVGSPRDLMLHAKAGQISTLFERVSDIVNDKAVVLRTAEALELGILGPKNLVTQRYIDGLGDLIVLPRKGQQVFWSQNGQNELTDKGFHGGLSPEELEIPCLAMVL